MTKTKYSEVPKGVWLAKESSGVYQVMVGSVGSLYRITRNDNELEPGGCRELAWQVQIDLEAYPLTQEATRAECLRWVKAKLGF